MTKETQRQSAASAPTPQAILDLSVAVIDLYFRIEAATETIAGFAHAGGEWGVLRSLSEGGPQTVPDMARARPVSRQHCQSIVNELKARKLVELIDNPRHKRSQLVKITMAGQSHFDKMTGQFLAASAALAPHFDAREVEGSTKLLRQAHALLSAGA